MKTVPTSEADNYVDYSADPDTMDRLDRIASRHEVRTTINNVREEIENYMVGVRKDTQILMAKF